MILWTDAPWNDGKTEVGISGAAAAGLSISFINSSDRRRMDQARANARLISKAPDLARALLFEDAMHHQDFTTMHELGWDPGGEISAGQFAHELRTEALSGVPYLKKAQIGLLQWLSREESSALGECHGKDLDRLAAIGFVSIGKGRHKDRDNYSRVYVTAEGWSFLESRKEMI
jgi:hypothetical protein